jgi:hypothetical protein
MTLSSKRCLFLLVIAGLTFAPTLFLPYIGEEAVYTVGSYEMHYHQAYWVPLYYGSPYWRGPLFNWLMIPFADLFSWTHVLIAARFVTMLSTLGTAWMLGWLTQKLWNRFDLAAAVALIYLTSDAGFYHGWLAYADPLYNFFSFSAVALLWVSILERRSWYYGLSALMLAASYLTKGLTGYFFYLTAWIGLYSYYSEPRRFMLKFFHLLFLFLAFSTPLLWAFLTKHAGESTQGSGMIHDIIARLMVPSEEFFSWKSYLKKLFLFPAEWILKLFPITLLALYGLMKHPSIDKKIRKEFFFIGGLLLINLAPYWFSPQPAEARYLMMMYPLYSILLGLFFFENHQRKGLLYSIVGLLILKVLWVCVVLPIYLTHYRGSYANTAKMILNDHPTETIYINDVTSVGESVAVNMDLQRFPKAPITGLLPSVGKFLVLQDPDHPSVSGGVLLKIYPSSDSHSKIGLYEVNR